MGGLMQFSNACCLNNAVQGPATVRKWDSSGPSVLSIPPIHESRGSFSYVRRRPQGRYNRYGLVLWAHLDSRVQHPLDSASSPQRGRAVRFVPPSLTNWSLQWLLRSPSTVLDASGDWSSALA